MRGRRPGQQRCWAFLIPLRRLACELASAARFIFSGGHSPRQNVQTARPITLMKPITMPLTCGWLSANLPLVSAPIMSATQLYYQEKTRADDLAYHHSQLFRDVFRSATSRW